MFEKTRVVSEDVYHIFYYLLNAPDRMKNTLKLSDLKIVCIRFCWFLPKIKTENYFYSSNFKESLPWNMPANDNSLAEKFHDFDNALQKFGFDDSQRIKVYMALSGVIYLNMIEFQDNPHAPNSGSVICESSALAIERVAELFAFSSAEIKQLMTKRHISVQNENIE